MSTIATFQVAPNPLLTRESPPRRLIELRFASARTPRIGRAIVTLGKQGMEFDLGSVPPGEAKVPILVPEVVGPTSGTARLVLGSETWEQAFILAPARPWTLYVIPHSHTDIGFTHPPSEVAQIHDENTDEAITLCELTRSWPPGCAFRWTIEVSWQLQSYLRTRSETWLARLRECLKRGEIELAGLHSGIHTDLCGLEELARSLYFAASLRRAWGITVETAMVTDIPGVTWPYAQILAKAGMRYLIVADNNFVAPFLRHTDVPRPFYWEAPEGSRILAWYTDDPRWVYLEGFKLGFDKSYRDVVDNLPGRLVELERQGYPYASYPIQFASDNCRVLFRPALITREWTERWANPILRLATAREFMADIECACGSNLPVCQGDWTNYWSATALGMVRAGARMRYVRGELGAAEKLNTWANALGHVYPRALVAAGYENLLVFDEHSGPKSLAIPKSEEQQLRALHEGYAFPQGAASATKEALAQGLKALSTRISNASDEHAVVVFNSLSWQRDDVAELVLPRDQSAEEVVDSVSGQSMPYALDPASGRLRFLARDVSAMGYRIFFLRRERKRQPQSKPPKATERSLENEYYLLTLDDSGRLCSLLDKNLGWDLIATDEPLTFGGLVWWRPKPPRQFSWEAGTFSFPELYDGTPVPGEMTVERSAPASVYVTPHGDLAASLTIEWQSEAFCWRQEFLLYAGLRRVETIYNFTPNLESEGNQSRIAYLVFPLFMERSQFRIELPGAILAPENQQLKGSCRDFFATQSWVAAFDGQHNLVFSSLEAPLLELGRRAPAFQQYHPAWRAEAAQIWVRAFSEENFKGPADSPWTENTPLTFRFVLTTFGGAFAPLAATHHGWAALNPLLTHPLLPTQKGPLSATCVSWCQIEPENVLLVTIKLAEDGDGFILRLWEATGRDSEAHIRLPLLDPSFAAWRTNLVEDDREPLRIQSGAVTLPIKGWGIETVRIRGARIRDI